MDIPIILSDKYAGTQWILNGDDYEGLEWLDKKVQKPTKDELLAAWAEVQHTRAVAQVERVRAEAYRQEADPMFFRYQRGEATKAEWEAAVKSVRDRFPYPEAS